MQLHNEPLSQQQQYPDDVNFCAEDDAQCSGGFLHQTPYDFLMDFIRNADNTLYVLQMNDMVNRDGYQRTNHNNNMEGGSNLPVIRECQLWAGCLLAVMASENYYRGIIRVCLFNTLCENAMSSSCACRLEAGGLKRDLLMS